MGALYKTVGFYKGHIISPLYPKVWDENFFIRADCSGAPLSFPHAPTPFHHAPNQYCSCGIYSSTSVRETLGYGKILIQVRLGGVIIPYSQGYRSEEAQAIGLLIGDIPGLPRIPARFLWDLPYAALIAKTFLLIPRDILEQLKDTEYSEEITIKLRELMPNPF